MPIVPTDILDKYYDFLIQPFIKTLFGNTDMAAYSDAVKQSFFHKIVCGGTADSQNVLYLIYGISAFFIANSTLLILRGSMPRFFLQTWYASL